MQLVEQHVIRRTDRRFEAIDEAAFASTNLYNAANYLVRKSFLFQGRYLPYNTLDKLMQPSPDYCALPRKVSQWVLRQLDHDWQAFFVACKAYRKNPAAFMGRPHLPKYKDKHTGRNLLTYTSQALSKNALKQNVIRPSGLAIEVPTRQTRIRQVRIVPHRLRPLGARLTSPWRSSMRSPPNPLPI